MGNKLGWYVMVSKVIFKKFIIMIKDIYNYY